MSVFFKKHHRHTLLEKPFPEAWDAIIAADVPYERMLNEAERKHLRDLTSIIIDEKNWEGCGGLEIDDRVKVVIATQAAVLLLNLEMDIFRNVRSFLIYPSAYHQTQENVGRDGMVNSGTVNLGEAWYNGPVIFSWKDALESAHQPGRANNVVFHEMAHTIDMLTGQTNGTPPLRERDHYATWHEVMSSQFREVQRVYESGRRDVIRDYGVVNVAEFFAVCTETFFDNPVPFKKHRPELYAQLQLFYGQDPASRFSR
jgi:Mlc titration factor MtfA (ptsG expression regulator)